MLNPKGPSHFKSSLRTPAILLVAGVTLTACSARPGPRPASATPEAEPLPVRSVGTMSELMVDILYPASDAVFYIETRTPSTGEEWALLQMQKGMLHPTINIDQLDPEIDLDVCANRAVEHQIRCMLKNSFGFGGLNCCSLIKRYEG